MTIRVRIKTLESNAGDAVDLSESGVTCLVGGNNAGKSRTLTDLASRMRTGAAPMVVLRGLQVDKAEQISLEEAHAFLAETAVPMPGSLAYTPMGGGTQIADDGFRAHFGIHPNALEAASEFFLRHWSAGSLSRFASESLGHVGVGTPSATLFTLSFATADLSKRCPSWLMRCSAST
jgi:hypothetical protein